MWDKFPKVGPRELFDAYEEFVVIPLLTHSMT